MGQISVTTLLINLAVNARSRSHLSHSLRSHDVVLVRDEGHVVPVRGSPARGLPVLPLPLLVPQVWAAPRQPQPLCVILRPGNEWICLSFVH